jgi:hypothetical protein
MATLDDEIKAAEKKMRQAYDALIEYVEKPAFQPADIKAPSSPRGRTLREQYATQRS